MVSLWKRLTQAKRLLTQGTRRNGTMKKLFLTAFAILALASFALAANYPAINPNGNPSPATTVVYNNMATTASKGDTVCWDADASTGDDKNFITTTCGADSVNVAGVVWPVDITAKSSGSVAIFGVVNVNLEAANSVMADTPLCASSTAGKAEYCADDSYLIGIATETTTTAAGATVDAMILIAPSASSIARVNNPKDGPEIWTVPVYSAAAVDAGDVVIWAVDDSTGDNDYWVKTTTTGDTVLVAGVVWPGDIGAGEVGTIATRGVVPVDGVGIVAAGGPICTHDATAGEFISCVADKYSFGISVAAPSGGSTKCYINP